MQKHSPTLNTILMVEKILKKGELMSLADLKRELPKKVMHQTLLEILDYLQLSGKIIIGTKGILWIYTERKELNELIKKGVDKEDLIKELKVIAKDGKKRLKSKNLKEEDISKLVEKSRNK